MASGSRSGTGTPVCPRMRAVTGWRAASCAHGSGARGGGWPTTAVGGLAGRRAGGLAGWGAATATRRVVQRNAGAAAALPFQGDRSEEGPGSPERAVVRVERSRMGMRPTGITIMTMPRGAGVQRGGGGAEALDRRTCEGWRRAPGRDRPMAGRGGWVVEVRSLTRRTGAGGGRSPEPYAATLERHRSTLPSHGAGPACRAVARWEEYRGRVDSLGQGRARVRESVLAGGGAASFFVPAVAVSRHSRAADRRAGRQAGPLLRPVSPQRPSALTGRTRPGAARSRRRVSRPGTRASRP